MQLDIFLKRLVKKLEAAGIGTARLDALVLLEDATGKDRAYLLAHPEFTVQGPTLYSLNKQVAQRAKHIPLAYIRQKTEFYGREFLLNHDVLEPRPESETMIDLFKKLITAHFENSKVQPWKVVDVGTGSGAIGITAKLEVPEITITGTDIDPNCLKLAEKNIKKYSVEMILVKGDLLLPIQVPTDIILANLPYVPDSYQINQAAMMEPRIAIFGGPDGLDLYRKMFDQIDGLNQKPQHVLTESLPFQHKELEKIAKKTSYRQTQEDDFIQVFSTT